MRRYATVTTAVTVPSFARAAGSTTDLAAYAPYLLMLMLRNVATPGYVFADPFDPGRFAVPGCVIASPSYSRNQADVSQNYVFNWTRDAALVAVELAAWPLPTELASGVLDDYVRFADLCQRNAPGGDVGLACWTIEGGPREWSSQYDGPALQILAILALYDQLGVDAQAVARTVAQRDLDFLMVHLPDPSVNLWEEVYGHSFFTRSVQLRCLDAVASNRIGLTVPGELADAAHALSAAVDDHWNGEIYTSVRDAVPLDPTRDLAGYDPNIDIVLACVCGALDCADPRLIATAARLRAQWSEPESPVAYPVNDRDAALDLGPMLGRYPGDVYDGDDNTTGIDHPWAVCTAALAELYYRLAVRVARTRQLPTDSLTRDFLDQVGLDGSSDADAGVIALREAGDRMLRAVIAHSDHLELSEQYDGATGFEKSVRNLTWSYAAVLSALRARAGRER